MPGLGGFETARLIRSRERSRYTPIIFLTAYDSDTFPVAEAYKLGAVDYLVKPLIPDILRTKGILAFKDDDKRFVIQGVHMILDGDHQREWKKDEKRTSRMVFIGRQLPEEKIRQGFESCVA